MEVGGSAASGGSGSDDDMGLYVPLKQRRALEEAKRAAKRGRPGAGTNSQPITTTSASVGLEASTSATYDFGPGARAGESLFDQARRAVEAGEAPTELDKQRTLEREIMAQVSSMAVPR